MALPLNRYETFMARKAANAELCDFTTDEYRGNEVPEIRGKAIRAILLGLPVILDGDTQPVIVEVMGPGLRLKPSECHDDDRALCVLNARVSGMLDLDHGCRKDGTPLPFLSLQACTFEGPLELSHAHLRGLNLAGSRLAHLCARHAVFDGEVDITGIWTSEKDGEGTGVDKLGKCWADLHGATIGSVFHAGKARLVAPARRTRAEVDLSGAHYALDLGHCRLNGSVILMPEFNAVGGVSVNLAKLFGNIRADGANVVASEDWALFAEDVEVRGYINLNCHHVDGQPSLVSKIKGSVSFFGATISENFEMKGVQIVGNTKLTSASVGANIWLNADQNDEEIYASNFKGDIDFSTAVVGGNLNMGGASLERSAHDNSREKFGGNLLAGNIKIGGGAVFNPIIGKSGGEEVTAIFKSAGRLHFYAAAIRGNLEMEGAQIGVTESQGELNSLMCEAAEIGGSVILRKFGNNHPFSAAGNLRFYATKIGGSFDISGAKIENGINAKLAEIKGDFFFMTERIRGLANCQGMGVGSRLYVGVGDADGVKFELTDAHVGTLIDEGGEGFGKKASLALEGFTYGRLTMSSVETKRLNQVWKKRLAWLNLQYPAGRPNQTKYRPGPYMQLIKVLNHEGRYGDARKILSEKLRLDNSQQSNLLNQILGSMHGWLFGFGLNGPRAVMVFLACIAIGAAAVSVADDSFERSPTIRSVFTLAHLPVPRFKSVLVADTSATRTQLAPNGNGEMTPAFSQAPGYTSELPCGDAINPFLYAVDEFIPVLDLRQESRCSVASTAPGWQFASLAYAILGWIVTSLTILTLTGILRRYEEG